MSEQRGDSPSTPSTWNELEPLLDEVFDLDPEDRSTYLKNLQGDKADLAAQLALLLAAEEPDRQVRARLDPLLDKAMESLDDKHKVEGRVGAWQLEEEIGRGGMGRVYRAVRADGQYQQKVALKVLAERLGDRLAHQRFVNERQILARLAHPNVAQLIDGGVLEDGRPYFAMELVQGASILDFANQHNLAIDARVELLIQLCRGVEYAHRNLIVHRDIKPSNILVARTTPAATVSRTDQTENQDLVKLLDFGVAKMTIPDGATPLRTQTNFRPMTFEYASPEQIRGEDVTVSSDLYSLALVAYELLCGTQPFDIRSESLSSIARAAEATNLAPRASARFSALPSETQERTAASRSTTARVLLQQLRADLDHMLAKALRKQPESRYESVAELRHDLERFHTGLPIKARRGSTRYRVQKFVARNRLAAGATLLVVASVLTGIAGVLWQTTAAAKERDRAVLAEAKAQAINRFLLDDLLAAAAPENARGREITVVQALDESALRIAKQFADQPDLDTEVRGTIGDVYLRLGRADKAEPHLRHSFKAAQHLGSEEAMGIALRRLAQLAVTQGDRPLALEQFEQAHAHLRKGLGPEALLTIVAEAQVARSKTSNGRRVEGIEQQEAVLAKLESLHPSAWRERLTVMNDLAMSYVEVRRAQEAEALAVRTLALQKKHLGEDHPDLVGTLEQLAQAQLREYRPIEALHSINLAEELVLRIKGSEARELNRIGRIQLGAYRSLYRQQEALPIAQQVVERTLRSEGEDSFATAQAYNHLGVTFSDLGRHSEARAQYHQAAQIFLRSVGEYHASYLRALRNVTATWERQDATQTPGAAAGLRKSIDLLLETERRAAKAQTLDATLLADLANDFVRRQRSPQDLHYALTLATEAVERSDRKNWEALQSLGRSLAALGRGHEAMIVNLEALAKPGALKSQGLARDIPALYEDLGQTQKILPMLEALLERRRAALSATDTSIGLVQHRLARHSRTLGARERSESYYRDAIAQFAHNKGPRYHRLMAARSELGELLLDQGQLEEAKPLILDAFEAMLDTPYLFRELQVATTERAIRYYQETHQQDHAKQLAGHLDTWTTLPIHSPWRTHE